MQLELRFEASLPLVLPLKYHASPALPSTLLDRVYLSFEVRTPTIYIILPFRLHGFHWAYCLSKH